jgi:hypothetical protein
MTLVQPAGEMHLKIREELREPDADAIERDCGTIREWLEMQPHLPKDIDDQRLKTFLRGCKFSLEKVKRKLDMYYTMRNAIPEFFADRDVLRPELSAILNYIQLAILPGLTPAGRRVTIFRGDEKSMPTPNVSDTMKLTFMLGDIRLVEEQLGVGGDVIIFDASVATPAHFAKYTPAWVKKFLICTQEAYPVKLKEIHIINVSPLVDTIVNFVKPLLKEKIRQRIFFHADLESLYKYVPKSMLPSEYKGDGESIKIINEEWRKKLIEYGPWFKAQENSKANEALRPGSPKTSDDLFGMDGTFRKLTID